jgi:hypothetical protein
MSMGLFVCMPIAAPHRSLCGLSGMPHRRVVNYPIINHSRARGLMHKLRFRLMHVLVSGSWEVWGILMPVVWTWC